MGLKKILKKFKKQAPFKQVQIGNYSLIANAIHPIEEYLNYYKYYSRNLPRIAKYMESKYPVFGIIDVGANIGDSIALFRSAGVDQHVYSIEGEPTYLSLLKQNAPLFKDITIFETFLGETNEQVTGITEVNDGTARLNKNTTAQIEVKKLDDLARDNKLENIKLLKVDTDGFDFKILRGSLSFIKEQTPVLFFEYDASYLEEQGEHGTNMFNTLSEIGYNTAIYYDNYGKLLISVNIANTQQINQLYSYMRKKDGAFPYYDVCLFHQNDDALAQEIIEKEAAFYN